MWFEPLRLVTVLEPPNRHDFFGDPAAVEQAEALRDEVLDKTSERVRSDAVLAHVLSADAASVEEPTHEAASAPVLADAEDPWAVAAPLPAREQLREPVSVRPVDSDVPLRPDPGPDPWDETDTEWGIDPWDSDADRGQAAVEKYGS